jgi:hypothetical protein
MPYGTNRGAIHIVTPGFIPVACRVHEPVRVPEARFIPVSEWLREIIDRT